MGSCYYILHHPIHLSTQKFDLTDCVFRLKESNILTYTYTCVHAHSAYIHPLNPSLPSGNAAAHVGRGLWSLHWPSEFLWFVSRIPSRISNLLAGKV